MRKLLFIIGIIALLGNAKAQTVGEHFDVTHYEIHLWDFNFSDHTLQGEAFIDLQATERTDVLVLELKYLTVTDVACDMIDVTSYEQEDDLLTIHLDVPLEVGENAMLDVRYGGNTFNESWGGVHWWGADYVYNLGVGFESIPHNLGKTWFPCVDNFTDKATYSLAITVDNNKKAICGGLLTSTFDNGDGTTTWYWEVPQKISTYHISFTIGNYELWEDVYHGLERDIPVEVYVKPAQLNNVPGTFANVKAIAGFYEDCLGPYPFNRIGYICTGQGCMEHIDNIAVTSGIITGNTTQEEYVAHELSHMYFGNKTTCSTAGDMWLNEGFAQFWGMFYRAGVYDEENFQSEMVPTINTITNWCNSESNWIPLNNIPETMTYDSKAVYDRGAVIVNTMMNYMGRETFLAGLRHYLDLYSYGTATSEQLRDALTESSGIDMQGFFDTYVFHGGMPHYGVTILDVAQNGGQYDVELRMNYEHIGPSHVGQNNRVEITFVGADGQLRTEMVLWDGVESLQTVAIDFEPIAAFADYDNHYLDAKLDRNVTATSPMTFTVSYLKNTVKSVTDSTMLRTEAHFVRPEDDPEIPGLNLSTRHYWNVLRLDFGDAEVEGTFSFANTSSMDGDIIHTQNDSAVLLYRANVHDIWHTVPYTQQGNWKVGTFTVSQLQTGQYTIGAIDKSIYSTEEDLKPSFKLFPNPTDDQVTLIWDQEESGCVKVYDTHLKLVKSIPYNYCKQITFSLQNLTRGVYFVEHQGRVEKVVKK